MLRLQEHYECPEFRNQYFTWDEYVEWYVKYHETNFDYLDENAGYNVPGNFVSRFYCKFADYDFTQKEGYLFSKLVKYINIHESDYYIIATADNVGDLEGYMAHEVRHAMFYLIPAYRDGILKIVRRYKVKRLRKALLDYGYHKAVVEDEIQAYVLTGLDDFAPRPLTLEIKSLRKELRKVEQKFITKGKIHVEN